MPKGSAKPALRFKGFTDAWEQRKLGEVAAFNPKDELPDEFEYVDLESVVGIEMLFHRTEKRKTAPSRAQRLARKGDLFYQTVRPYQKNNYLFEKSDNNYVFSTGYTQMRPYIDGYFLLSLVQSEQFVEVVLNNCTGTSYPAISSVDLAEIEVYSPKEEHEHRQIGAFFRSLDTLITLHQRKCDKLMEVKKSMLERMFPKDGANVAEVRFKGFTEAWDKRKVEEITTSYSGGTPTVGVKMYYGGTIPFIRSAEINCDSTELFITEEGLKNSSAKLVSVGDILYALYGATGGEVGRAKLNGAINQAILAVKPMVNYDAEFISQWLRKNKQNIVESYLQGGQGNLSGEIVRGLVVDLPSYDEQIVIGKYFRCLDTLITLYQHKLEKLKNIKKACLEKMFA